MRGLNQLVFQGVANQLNVVVEAHFLHESGPVGTDGFWTKTEFNRDGPDGFTFRQQAHYKKFPVGEASMKISRLVTQNLFGEHLSQFGCNVPLAPKAVLNGATEFLFLASFAQIARSSGFQSSDSIVLNGIDAQNEYFRARMGSTDLFEKIQTLAFT